MQCGKIASPLSQSIATWLEVLTYRDSWPSDGSDRFIRQLRDKLSEQERAFREELQTGVAAREAFQKVLRVML